MIVDLPAPEEPRSATVCPGQSRLRAQHPNGHIGQDRLGFLPARLGVGHPVGLVQEHDGLGAALASQHEVSFEPTQVEVRVAAHDDEDRVDIRGDHLGIRGGACDLPREPGAPREDAVDQVPAPRFIEAVDDPVAHRGKLVPLAGHVTESAGHARQDLSPLGRQGIDVRVREDDPPRLDARP
jgi:hypothetical protein